MKQGWLAGLLAVADWRSHAVWRRNARVYFRNWRTAFLPPAMEPVIFFLAFGLGLGGYVGTLAHGSVEVPYATWVAPGLIAYTAFGTPFFEGLYSAYVRMFYQKTWDGILATQVEVEHIVWGEILWAGTRGAMNTAVVCCVLLGFKLGGIIDIKAGWLVAAPFVAGILGWVFGAFALLFTATVPSIDHMNYPTFLVGIPLGLVSNTYFPVPTEPPALGFVVRLNPLYHLSETLRSVMLGRPSVEHALWLFGLLVVYLVLLVPTAQRLIRRRLLRG